jgi:malonyl-CoA/methylmalonyl-CoA synthetase
VASALLVTTPDLGEARVALLVPPGWHYVAAQWGIWRAGGVVVPLAVSHPPAELAYTIADAQADVIVAHPEFADRVDRIAAARGVRVVLSPEALGAAPGPLPAVEPSRAALIFYTSGTTGKPKGAVHTHASIQAQVESLVEAWEWTASDHILGVLPLHHVHGVVNVLACALWSGAICELMPRFDARDTWDRFAAGGLTLFMAVPTIYAKLVAAWDETPAQRRAALSAGCRGMRLMVSGSAALPVSVLERWREISGHTLLERYGMTEIGMALSNPLRGERRPGYVGTPLPGVRVRVVDDGGIEVAPGVPGEIEVRGPGVFRGYWNRPADTRAAFRDGWFRTGDIAMVEQGSFRILGRKNVDIIKTGGFKVSSLEIEEVLREHPDVTECAVVGVADVEWGERVCAAVVARPQSTVAGAALRDWARERLASYKVPSRVLIVRELPRNAMGKVTKQEVRKLFGPDAA